MHIYISCDMYIYIYICVYIYIYIYVRRIYTYTSYVYVCVCVWVCLLSHAWLFATPWTVAHQASLSMGFSQQEHWSGLPFPPLEGLSYRDQTVSLTSPALASRFFTTEPPRKPTCGYTNMCTCVCIFVCQLKIYAQPKSCELNSIQGSYWVL